MNDKEIVALFKALCDAYEMVEDAIVVAEKALLNNPQKEERRELEEDLLELKAKRLKQQRRILIFGRNAEGAGIPMPSDEQIEKLKELAAKVDNDARMDVQAEVAIGVTTTVLKTVIQLQMT